MQTIALSQNQGWNPCSEHQTGDSLTCLTCTRVSRPLVRKAIHPPYYQFHIDSTSSALFVDALDAFLSDTRGLNAVVVAPVTARDSRES